MYLKFFFQFMVGALLHPESQPFHMLDTLLVACQTVPGHY